MEWNNVLSTTVLNRSSQPVNEVMSACWKRAVLRR
jgi:hypothetical protein